MLNILNQYHIQLNQSTLVRRKMNDRFYNVIHEQDIKHKVSVYRVLSGRTEQKTRYIIFTITCFKKTHKYWVSSCGRFFLYIQDS